MEKTEAPAPEQEVTEEKTEVVENTPVTEAEKEPKTAVEGENPPKKKKKKKKKKSKFHHKSKSLTLSREKAQCC